MKQLFSLMYVPISLIFLSASFYTTCLAADADFCSKAAQCCKHGMDEDGWIAAAIGWSLWFLTLILLCVGKLRKITPDESKHTQA